MRHVRADSRRDQEGGGHVIVTRRSFLIGVGAATAGLALGFDRSARAGESTEMWNANPFIQIGNDGTIMIVCSRSEMGQGIRSSIPVLIADELGADPATVTIVQGDGNAVYGDQDTDGSHSIRGHIWDDVRPLAATARAMLITAAAQRWKVPEARLVARDGAVHDGAKQLRFAELAQAASQLAVPKHVAVRALKDLTHVGKQLPQRDAPDIVAGRAKYGADTMLPGMLTAVIARPPVLFGKVKHFDPKTALAIPGVVQVIELPAPKPPIAMQALGGVAVIATNTWAAERGRRHLEVEWDHGPNAAHDSIAYTQELRDALLHPDRVVRSTGDAQKAIASAASQVEAEYVVPYLVHSPMEPPAAVAHVVDGKCELWAPSQDPQGMQAEVAKALGIDQKHVTVHVTLLGGGFGRKSFPDFGVEAAQLARLTGKPVRVQWTRPDDLRHSSYHTHSVQQLRAGLDAHGTVIGWHHKIAYPPIGSTFDATQNHPGDGELHQGVTDLPLAVPNVLCETATATAHMRIGWMRSVCNVQQAFAVHSFIDEIAHATKRDPRDTMLQVFGPARKLTAGGQGVKKLADNYGNPLTKTPFDVARLEHVIARVSEMASWDTAKREGRAVGMAAHSSFASWIAVACEVAKGPRGEIRVENAWIAADCGFVVNPDRVRSQMEGAFVFAMSNALHGRITVKAGAVVESNFRDYKLLRMPEAPKQIHIELVPSEMYPGGAGEPGVPPVAPAIANAWFALTGVRLRSFPFEG
ncbi:MAG TPA: molybdopterin cofactor-binding domain-containing protein [Kofleriaceae bacterium]